MPLKWEGENHQTVQSLILITCTAKHLFSQKELGSFQSALLAIENILEKEYSYLNFILWNSSIFARSYLIFINYSLEIICILFQGIDFRKTEEKDEIDVQFVQFCGQPILILQRMTSSNHPIIKQTLLSFHIRWVYLQNSFPSDVPHILFQDICSSWCFQDKQKKAIGVLSWKIVLSFQ